MKPELTIIIPCYNCTATLKESVDSCFTQGLSSFEIVMVNDSSTDQTQDLIESLAIEHKEIRFFKNEINLGGGATRNRAVEESLSDIIFCLDSDDVLPENTLVKMLSKMKATQADGILFQGGLSFKKTIDVHKKYTFNENVAEAVTIDDFFAGKTIGVTANFMYTKNAHALCGGYPTHHNFDTQGYGVRFMMLGLKAFTCEDAFFYQRQFAEEFSYFERAYNSGEFSLGHSYILLDSFHILSNETRSLILNFDVFKNNKLDKNDLFSHITAAYKKDKSAFFISGYEKYLSKTGLSQYLEETTSSKDPLDLLIKGHTLWKNNTPEEAVSSYNKYILETKTANTFVYFLLLHTIITESNKDKRIMHAQGVLQSLLLTRVTGDVKRPSILKRIVRKIIKTIHK
jgi:glycosyltransferase involved in cell wall biosynthesis